MNDLARMENKALLAQNAFNPELYKSWLEYVDGSPRTVETYTKNIKRLAEYFADNGITKPERTDIKAYRDYLKENYKPTTVQGYMAAVKLFFRWTEAENLYPNIADNVKAAKVDPKHKNDYLTTKQVKRLLAGVDTGDLKGLRDYAIILLMTTTGLRTVSVVNANIGDIRPTGDNRVLYYKGKGHEEKSTYVMLAEPVEEAINAYLEARGKASASEPLFASTSNNGQGTRITTRALRAICEAHGINAHMLRHTAATINLRNGATLEETQQLLDHSNINTTLIYAAEIAREKNQSERRIAKAIFG